MSVKGILKGVLYITQDIVTLGGHGRIQDAQARYDVAYEKASKLSTAINQYKTSIERSIRELGEVVQAASKVIAAIPRMNMASTLGAKGGVTNNRHREADLTQIHKFNTGVKTAAYATAGAAAGTTMAVGSWAAVAAFGAASTGTAISTLTGVASTNAILAWFGGGALAAGGAGMSGGMMVIGGIVALPMVYFATKSSHKKADAITKEAGELEGRIPRLTLGLLQAEDKHKALAAILLKVNDEYAIFSVVERRTRVIIFPSGVFSKFYQWLRGSFGSPPYSEAQEKAIVELVAAASRFCGLFDEVDVS